VKFRVKVDYKTCTQYGVGSSKARAAAITAKITTPTTVYFNASITPPKHTNEPLKRYGSNELSDCLEGLPVGLDNARRLSAP